MKALKLALALSTALAFPAYAQQATVLGPTGSGGGSVTCGPGITGCPSGPISPTLTLGNSGANITGTTYSIDLTTNITTTDLARQLKFTGTSASAWTLGAGSAGMAFDVVNRGTANITITATGNINGASTLVVYPGTWAAISHDGTTWTAENLPLTSAAQFGVVKVDGSTITAINGVISAPGASGSGFNPQYAAGRTFPMVQDFFSTSNAATAGEIEWIPVQITAPITISKLGTGVQTVSAGGKFSVALYAADSSFNATGSPLAATPINTGGDLSTATAGTIMGDVNGGTPYSLAKGNYVVGFNADNSTVKFIDIGSGSTATTAIFGVATASHLYVSGGAVVRTTTQAYASGWPTNPTTTEAASFTPKMPIPVVTVSSVP